MEPVLLASPRASAVTASASPPPPTPIFLIKAEHPAKKAFIFLSAVSKRSNRRRKVAAPSNLFYSTLITFNSRLSRRHSFDFLHLTNEATLQCAATSSDPKQQPDGFNVRKRRTGSVYWEGIVAETMRARVTLLFWLQNTKQGWCLGGDKTDSRCSQESLLVAVVTNANIASEGLKLMFL